MWIPPLLVVTAAETMPLSDAEKRAVQGFLTGKRGHVDILALRTLHLLFTVKHNPGCWVFTSKRWKSAHLENLCARQVAK